MAAWPSTLPAPLLGSYTEQPAPNVIRSDMDIGPDKVRRRSTSDLAKLEFALMLDSAGVATLDGFYRTTCRSGALAFDFPHPRTGATVSARFVAPYQVAHHDKGLWRVSVSLESRL